MLEKLICRQLTFSEIPLLFLFLSLKSFAILPVTAAIKILSIRKMIAILNKKWLSRNSHQRKSFTIFNAINSLFTTIQSSIFSLMMTKINYCTYIPLSLIIHQYWNMLMLQYQSYLLLLKYQNFRRTKINTDGRIKIYVISHYFIAYILPKSIVQTIFSLHVLQKYNL